VRLILSSRVFSDDIPHFRSFDLGHTFLVDFYHPTLCFGLFTTDISLIPVPPFPAPPSTSNFPYRNGNSTFTVGHPPNASNYSPTPVSLAFHAFYPPYKFKPFKQRLGTDYSNDIIYGAYSSLSSFTGQYPSTPHLAPHAQTYRTSHGGTHRR
jgi:hypothetical protein